MFPWCYGDRGRPVEEGALFGCKIKRVTHDVALALRVSPTYHYSYCATQGAHQFISLAELKLRILPVVQLQIFWFISRSSYNNSLWHVPLYSVHSTIDVPFYRDHQRACVAELQALVLQN